jgi:hypothetical protein
MANTNNRSAAVIAALMSCAAVAGCEPAGNSADDVADELGKALDPDPDYVDRPSPAPQQRR